MRAGSNKRAGRIFLQILINKQVLIRASRLEKIKILGVKLQSGRNFHDIFKNKQALLWESRLENDQKFLVRACSRNRDTRVFLEMEIFKEMDNFIFPHKIMFCLK
jgi:23S rRNA G2445 N2-methylase RlmL